MEVSAQRFFGDQPGYVSGRWYNPLNTFMANGTALSASTIRLIPFMIRSQVTISDLGATVVAQTTGNVQLAFYAANPSTMAPTGNALATTASLSVAALGTVSGAIVGGNVVLRPGLYWMAINSDNAVVVMRTYNAAIVNTGFIVGSTTMSLVATQVAYSVAQTYGTWPDLTAASFTEVASAANAIVNFKVA